jgi:hypothetical protein
MTTDDLDTASDRLLSEVDRQTKYLERLPEDYAYPLFNAAQALESQRRSGYRNTASAAREIIDNAMEAGATRIDVCFDKPKQLKPHQRHDAVTAVAFIDNGSGMLPRMARYALSWGSGTHFDDPAFIGKFGFGLPNASINQTRLVEVYTKVKGAPAITKARLDARDVARHGLQTIEAPVEGNLPQFVVDYMDRAGLAFDHGTVVVWVDPDRLSYRRAPMLKEHLVDDFGVTYRYLLDRCEIHVEKVKVEPVDPLFLTEGARYYLPEEKGGSQETGTYTIPVKYAWDDQGILALTKIEDAGDLDTEAEGLEAIGAIHVKVARFPYGFAESTSGKAETDAHRRFEIRKNRRGMSFVRAGREIETVDVFPKSIKDFAKGLGNWPLLQSYAYHWGVEVRFDPELDDVFGITNDKQTVRPVEDLWRILANEGVDRHLGREQAWQRKTRAEERARQNAAAAERADGPTPAEEAAAKADSISGARPQVPDRSKDQVRAGLNEKAKTQAKIGKTSIDAAKKALEAQAKTRPYVVDFFDEPRGPFYRPEWQGAGQVVARINRSHPFFEGLYAPLMKQSAAADAKQALDLLLLALARAELNVTDDVCAAWYVAQREQQWSVFLENGFKMLQGQATPADEEATVSPADEDEGPSDATAAEAA